MTQWSEAEGVMERTQEASGAMANAYELYTDSIEGRINTLKATLQGLSSDILDDSIIKTAVSGLTGIANSLDFIIDKLGILGTLATAGGIAKFISMFNNMRSAISSATSAIDGITDLTKMAQALSLYDTNVAKAVLSRTALNKAEQESVLINIQKIQQETLLSAAYANRIAIEASQSGGNAIEISQSIQHTAALNAETLGIKAVTQAQLEEILSSNGVQREKAEEIAARYANAGAAKAEGAAMSALGATVKSVLTFLKANPWILLITAVGAGIAALVNYGNKLKENAQNAKDEYNSLTSEVTNLESELAKVRDRLREIESIENPDIATQEEYDLLVKQNNELERELRLKEALMLSAQKEAENATLKDIDWYFRWNSFGSGYREDSGNVTINSVLQGYLNDAKKAQEQLEVAKQERDKYINDVESTEFKNADKDVEKLQEKLDKRVESLTDFYNKVKDEWMTGISGTTEEGKKLLDVFSSFEDELLPFLDEYNGVDTSQIDIGIDTNVNTDSIKEAENDINDLMSTIDSLSEKFDLLNSAQEEFNEYGVLSSSTLSSIAEKYPALVSSIEQYALGLKTSQELLNDLSSAYQTDEDNYRIALVHKYENSVEFYNSLTDNQKLLINELGEAYGVDLENFTTIEQKKLAIQAEIIKSMIANYKAYVGMSLDELKAQAKLMASKISPGMSNSSLQEYWNLLDAIEAIEGVYADIDEITISGISGPSSWNPSKIEESADKAKDEAEDLYEAIRDWFSDMEFKVSLKIDAGDIEGSEEMYKQMIDRVNEELSKAYAEGLTINDDWVQELIQKLQEYNKALSDLVLDEYDKLIEYNDDFDVWNKVSYSKLDVLADKLKKINDLYLEGILSYKDWYDLYMDTAKEIYDYQKDALEELLEQTMDAIEAENDARVEALESQKDAYNEIISLKKKLIEDTDEEADYEREVEKRVKEIAKLQERITQLALDDSREAYAERVKLEEELQQKQEELADYQADHAKDQVIDSLDEQQDKFEENIDEQIDSIKAEIDTEVELREQAINRINADYKKMMEDVKGYFAELGITLDDEVIRRLEEGLKLVSQYGDYGSAIGGIGSGSDIGSATGYELTSLIQQMKNNSSAWWDAKNSGNKEEMNRLSQENERIAQMLKTMFGLDIWKDSASGTWYIRTPEGKQKLFDVYHNGGVVDGYSTTNNREIMALLEKGEVVFDDGQQKKFVDIFKDAAIKMQKVFSNIFAVATETSGFSPIPAGATYAPSISVNIEHNGPMTDDDANKYANQIGNGTFDVLMEIMNRKGII